MRSLPLLSHHSIEYLENGNATSVGEQATAALRGDCASPAAMLLRINPIYLPVVLDALVALCGAGPALASLTA